MEARKPARYRNQQARNWQTIGTSKPAWSIRKPAKTRPLDTIRSLKPACSKPARPD